MGTVRKYTWGRHVAEGCLGTPQWHYRRFRATGAGPVVGHGSLQPTCPKAFAEHPDTRCCASWVWRLLLLVLAQPLELLSLRLVLAVQVAPAKAEAEGVLAVALLQLQLARQQEKRLRVHWLQHMSDHVELAA